ncbi:hypothetical protein BASA81_011063 [Batrachochytrium salamandrivorans]|nr:hypothetical protein BASA81_011063 [Batrachochytrium salamandrivorans]
MAFAKGCASSPAYAEGNIHASKQTGELAVAAPSKPDQPSMLFHRLGDKKFVTGKRLIDFNATNDKQKCTVLLAPSGAGKTRKLCELLNEKLGYFVPYKLGNDKNYGSEALSAVVSLLGRDPTIDWNKKDPVRDPS